MCLVLGTVLVPLGPRCKGQAPCFKKLANAQEHSFLLNKQEAGVENLRCPSFFSSLTP